MARLISQRKAVKPPNKLTDDRWKYLGLGQAQPNLGNAPTNNEGYTLKTDGQGKTTFDNTLGKLSFANSTITNTQRTDIVIDNSGNGKIILSPSTQVQVKGKLDVVGDTLIEGQIVVTGDNPLGTAPVIANVLYVNESGSDANDGRAEDPSRAKRTISGAVKSPYYQEGTTIRVASGHYWEDNPIPLKPSTCVIGDDLRTTFIEPLNKDVDLFWVNSGVYVAQIAMLNLRKGSVERYAPGGAGTYTTGAYCCAFPPKLKDPILVQYSPYIQNCTNQSGPWLFDGTMFRPNQTVQVPLGAGVADWNQADTTITVVLSTGTVIIGMSINDSLNAGYENAQTLLVKNIPFLQAEAVAYVDYNFPTFFKTYSSSTFKDNVSTIVDAVSKDARFGGNLRTRDTGESFWKGPISLIDGQQGVTSAAVDLIKTRAGDIIRNRVISTSTLFQTATSQFVDPALTNGSIVASSVFDLFGTISGMITGGLSSLPPEKGPQYGLIYPSRTSSDDITRASTVTNITSTQTGYANAQTLLIGNKSFIQSEVVEYVNQTYPGFVYDQGVFKKGIGSIVDAISVDGAVGGNIQSRLAGLSYYTGSISNIPGQIPQTVAAINYINTLAQQIISNNTVTSLTTASQYINRSLTSATVASNNIAGSINLITDIVTNGPLVDPGPVYPKLDQYVITLNTATVSYAVQSTVYFGYTTVYPVQDKDIPAEWVEARSLNPQGSGGGALVDGNAPAPNSPIQSFVFDAFTQLNQGGIGVHITNNGYAQLVSVFTIFCDIGVLTENGGICSITNSNANFGNYSLVSKGHGKLEFSGLIWNPKFPTNVPNGEYYPLGYWPQTGKMEVYIPDLLNRPHIALIMEVEPPPTYIDYTGVRVPYLNSEGYPGYLNATANTAVLTKGAYSIDGIDTTGIAVGNKLYIRDITGSTKGADDVEYLLPDTSIVDINFKSITLDQPIQSSGGDPANDFFFNLYCCGNAYYTVLSSEVDATVPQKDAVSWVDKQQEETALAIRHTRDITNKIITNTTITNVYQTATSQTFNFNYTGGENAVDSLSNKFNIIADMIEFGQITAPAIVKNTTLKTSDPGILSAEKLLENNKTFIQAETIAFIDKEFTGFTYDEAKCYRDTGLIVDSIALDMLYGGTSQSTFAGLQYWNQNGYTGLIPNEITTTTNTIKYVQDLATRVVRNITTGTRYQSTVTQVITTASNTASSNLIKADFDIIINILTSGTDGVTDLIVPNGIQSTNTNIINAYNSLQANKRYIQTEAIAWVEANKPSSFVYNRTTCRRDTSLIVDAMIMDTLFPTGSNSQSTFAGLQYWNQTGYTGQIRAEITTTTNAYKYLSSLSQQIIQNITTGTRYQSSLTQVTGAPSSAVEAGIIANEYTIITNILSSGTAGITDLIVPNGIESSTNIDVNRAYTLLQQNKNYIIAETISYIDATKTAGFTYDKVKCARDTGYILNSVCFDLLYGGNRQAIQSGVYYYNYTNSTAIPGESTQTVAAFNFIKSISRQIVKNVLVTATYQTSVSQVVNLPASTDAAGIVFGQKIDTVTKIITSGSSIVTTQEPISLIKTTDANLLKGADILLANKEFIKAEVIAYLDQTFSYYYDPALCYRDVGYMVDSVCFDLLHGGNRQAVTSGVYYYGFSSTASAIEGQRQETQFAYDHIIDLTNKILIASTVTNTYQSTITQVTNLPPASVDQVARAAQIISTITNIIASGPGVAADAVPIPLVASTDTNTVRAYNLIMANKSFIQAETLSFVNASFNDFSYDSVKCARDTGIILDSLAIDLLYQGSTQSNFAGLQYWNNTELTDNILEELTTTTNAIKYVKSLAQKVITNNTTGTRYQTTVTQVTNLPAGNTSATNIVGADFDLIVQILNSGTSGVTDLIVANGAVSSDINITRAYALLQANKQYIQTEAIAYVEATKTKVWFNYNQANCLRDTGLIIDSIAFDLLYPSNGPTQSNFAGLQYWSQTTSTAAVIPGEFTTTTNAINHMKQLAVTVANAAGGTTVSNIVNNNFATIVQILNSGTVGVSDLIVPNGAGSTATSYVNAYTALQTAKGTMIDDTINYINTNNPGFSYSTSTCRRDLGYIIDSVSFDLLHGGNRQSVMSGVYYYGYTTSTILINEIPQTTGAYNFIKNIVGDIIQGNKIETVYQYTTTQVLSVNTGTAVESTLLRNYLNTITNIILNGPSAAADPSSIGLDASTNTNVVNAFNLLLANKEFIKQETIAFVNYEYLGPAYDRLQCRRDTGLIVDALTQDLLFGGQSQSNFAGLQYWSQDVGYTGTIGSELTTTTNAIMFVRDLAARIVQNDTTGLRYPSGITQNTSLPAADTTASNVIKNDFNVIIDILRNGVDGVSDKIVPNSIVASTNTNIIRAYNLLQANKVFLQTQAIEYVENTKVSGFSYDKDLCFRDVGYMVDSVSCDLLYGGNRQAIQSGVYYYAYDGNKTVIPNEINVTTAAYNYIKTLATNIIQGKFITSPYQTRIEQVLSNTVGTTAEATIISNNIDLIVGIILNGPSSAVDKTAIGLTASTKNAVKAAATLLNANRSFIVEEVIAYVNTSFSGFQYDQAKCYRDVGYMIDSVSFDLLHGGNRQAIQSGVYYYTFDGRSTAIPNEIPQTAAAYKYLKTLVSNVIQGVAMPRIYQTSTVQIRTLPATTAEAASVAANVQLITDIITNGPSSAQTPVPIGLTASNSVNVTKAYNLLKANRQFIINEVIGYINNTFVKFSYDREKCYRDTGAILNAVIYDVLWGGNYRSVNTGNGYFSRKGRYHIVNLEENTQDPLLFIDGSTVNFYQRSYQSASGYLFEYIGAGTNYSALPQIGRKDPIQSHETVQLNNGKVFFTSTDQNGDFRIGPGLVISQATGVLYGRTFQKSLYAEMTPFVLVIGA